MNSDESTIFKSQRGLEIMSYESESKKPPFVVNIAYSCLHRNGHQAKRGVLYKHVGHTLNWAHGGALTFLEN